ncbi:hypothetical protein CEXT_660611 [Caerostris extrusa]|uniref:Uncharacterized protein n=1 Tax=Caerostris extrusa TaxID=172846 RepID=A0AAV4X1C1_CAEEX|nr:hypothetical protein CEXT_660611 [Caerostris extrusa]
MPMDAGDERLRSATAYERRWKRMFTVVKRLQKTADDEDVENAQYVCGAIAIIRDIAPFSRSDNEFALSAQICEHKFQLGSCS